MTKFGLEKRNEFKLHQCIGFLSGVLLVLAEWWLRTAISNDSGVQAMLFLVVIPFVLGVTIGFLFPGKVAAFNWGVFLGTISIAVFMGSPRYFDNMLIAGGFIGVFVVGVISVAALIGETLEMISRKRKQR